MARTRRKISVRAWLTAVPFLWLCLFLLLPMALRNFVNGSYSAQVSLGKGSTAAFLRHTLLMMAGALL